MNIKNLIQILFTIFFAASIGSAGEVEKFISETLAEQRARNAAEEQKATADALKTPEVPEFDLPKESIFTSKYKARDARYYKYDKSGRLVSVEYAATPAKNEYYTYDKQGNILEKKLGDKVYKYTYDSANQLLELNSPDGKREYFYDQAGRLVMEKLNGEIDVQYTYGYLDKVIEIDRRGKITKFAYDGFGMLASKTLSDGTVENWVWDGLALIRRGDDIYVNEPHISGGVPIVSKTKEGVRYHEHDFLGTTLWSMDTKGKVVKDYQDTTIFGEGSIQHDRSARFTGKPYDEDLQAYVFPYRNYDASTARWRTADPAGYPDGVNQHFYACIPTWMIDIMGLAKAIFFVGVDNSPAMASQFQGAYNDFRNSISLPDGDLMFATTVDNVSALKDIGSGMNYDVEIYVAAHGDTQIPNTFYNPGDWDNPIPYSDILALNKNIKDLYGCNPDGNITSAQLFERWRQLLSSYLER